MNEWLVDGWINTHTHIYTDIYIQPHTHTYTCIHIYTHTGSPDADKREVTTTDYHTAVLGPWVEHITSLRYGAVGVYLWVYVYVCYGFVLVEWMSGWLVG